MTGPSLTNMYREFLELTNIMALLGLPVSCSALFQYSNWGEAPKFKPIRVSIKFAKVPFALGKGIENTAGWPHRANSPEQGMLKTW